MVEVSGSGDDLDALIGDIRREAARRRAAPDFPVDEEAALAADMDRQGPVGGADLAGLVAELDRLAGTGPARAAAGRAGEEGSAGAPAAGGEADGGLEAARVAEIAGLVASVTRTLTRRLAHLERRAAADAGTGVRPATTGGPPPAASGPDPGGVGPGPDVWGPLVSEYLVAGMRTGTDRAPAAGPVLVAGPGAAEWVAFLASSAAGGAPVNVYGVDPARPEYSDAGPVRSGKVADHLDTVAAGGLAAVVLVGPVPVEEIPRLADLAPRLARAAGTVIVVSEAPWWWRRRVGSPAADLAATRPLGVETWLALLDGAGCTASARFGPQGRDYLVVAGRPAGGEGLPETEAR